MIIHVKTNAVRKDVFVPDNATIRDMIGIIGLGHFWGHKVCIDETDINMYSALAYHDDEILDRLVSDFTKQKYECTVVATSECGWHP